MTKKPHMCHNPCAKGRAGGCTGACAINFLGFDAGTRTLSAKVGYRPAQPSSAQPTQQLKSPPAKEDEQA